MKIKAYKRYCHKQVVGSFYNLTKVLDKNPEAIIEFNERSVATPYRIVTVTEFEVEVPDPPKTPEPRVPKPVPLPKDEFEYSTEEIPDGPGYWEKNRTSVVVRHTKTGLTVRETRSKYSNVKDDKDAQRRLRTELERKLDYTWKTRWKDYQEASHDWRHDRGTWDQSVRQALKEAVKK